MTGTLLVRGARVPQRDGTLSEPVDLPVARGRIAAITRTVPRAAAGTGPATGVLDAHGRVALPGFVDAHTHAEAAVSEPGVQLAMLRQGITTVVTGQDGVSFAPAG